MVVKTQGKTEDGVTTWRVMAGKQEGDQIRAERRKSELESILEELDLSMEEKAELLQFLTDQSRTEVIDSALTTGALTWSLLLIAFLCPLFTICWSILKILSTS